MTAQSMPGMHFVQEEVIAAFRKLYPPQFTAGLKEWPLVEDLLNQPPFTIYKDWRLGNGLQVDGELGRVSGSARPLCEPSGSWATAGSHGASCGPAASGLLRSGSGLAFPSSHHSAGQTLPTEQPICLDHDLLFAADFTWEHQGRLEAARMRNLGVLKELSRRWQVVTKHLRQFQPPAYCTGSPAPPDHFMAGPHVRSRPCDRIPGGCLRSPVRGLCAQRHRPCPPAIPFCGRGHHQRRSSIPAQARSVGWHHVGVGVEGCQQQNPSHGNNCRGKCSVGQ